MKITKEGGARSPGSVGAMEILPRLEGTLLLLLLLASSFTEEPKLFLCKVIF
jgi:hypothetical protein